VEALIEEQVELSRDVMAMAFIGEANIREAKV
jgi:hypothetical protein